MAGRAPPPPSRVTLHKPAALSHLYVLKKEEGSLVKNAFRGAVKTGGEEGRRAVADQPGKRV